MFLTTDITNNTLQFDGGSISVYRMAGQLFDVTQSTHIPAFEGQGGSYLTVTQSYIFGPSNGALIMEPLFGWEDEWVPSKVVTDELDEKPWSSVERGTSEDGTIAFRTEFRDDGTVRQTASQTSEFGQFGDITSVHDVGDTREWSAKISITYNGTPIGELTVMDDDRVIADRFDEGGNLELREMYDVGNTQSWSTMALEYSWDGQMTSRATVRDNGIEDHWYYENGQATHRVMTDTADAFNWTSKTTIYDDLGGTSFQITELDDGRQITKHLLEGSMIYRRVVDTEDAFAWHSIETWYDGTGEVIGQTRMSDEEYPEVGQFPIINFPLELILGDELQIVDEPTYLY